VTELWFVDGADHLGTVIIRHRLTPALERPARRSTARRASTCLPSSGRGERCPIRGRSR